VEEDKRGRFNFLPFVSDPGTAPEGLMPRRERSLSEPEALLSRRLTRRAKGGREGFSKR